MATYFGHSQTFRGEVFPSPPFHGGLVAHVARHSETSYRAFELLRQLGSAYYLVTAFTRDC